MTQVKPFFHIGESSKLFLLMILVTIHDINYVTFIIPDSVFYPLTGFTVLIWNHDFVFFGSG